jgi:hypothetical protein
MATIVDFCRDWQVYCPPLDIPFPPVYQVVHTITKQELARFAFPGEDLEPIRCWSAITPTFAALVGVDVDYLLTGEN